MQKAFNSIYFQVTILILSFAALYHHTFLAMAIDWVNDDNYSHGFLVPAIAAYMIWQRRDKLKALDPHTSYWGLVIMLTGIFFFIVGNIGSELFTMRLSIIIVIFGLSILLFGIPLGWQIAVPIFYLIFMIPLPAIIWNQVAFPLQLFAAKLSAGVISALGIPVLRNGNILELSNTTLEVVDACSGLRSLTSLLALSGAFAYIASLNKSNKCILFFSAVPIAISVNILRLSITAITAKYIGPETAQGFLHDFSGLLIFMTAILLLFLVYKFLSKLENKNTVSHIDAK